MHLYMMICIYAMKSILVRIAMNAMQRMMVCNMWMHLKIRNCRCTSGRLSLYSQRGGHCTSASSLTIEGKKIRRALMVRRAWAWAAFSAGRGRAGSSWAAAGRRSRRGRRTLRKEPWTGAARRTPCSATPPGTASCRRS